MKIQIRQISVSASEAAIGEHRVVIDRPIAKGGSGAGPMGGELFLAAVGGCFMSNLLAAIKARGADVAGVETEVTGTLADSPARFVAVELCVSAECPERALLEKVLEIASQGCIMVNTLKGKVDVKVSAMQHSQSAP
ncbi:MAG: OsmC family protein [Bryobacteraceae bacterium]